ncbi:MAG: sulfite exporter TauE/SafE family protein [Minisyncoccia bacterium]
MLHFLIILVTAFVSTALSSMSGGGASVINIPVLLFLGIPFPVATVSQKISSAFWVLPASFNYLKGRKVDWKFLIIFGLIGLVGVYAGVQFVVSVNGRLLEFIIGALILILVTYTFFRKDIGLSEQKIYSKFRQSLAYVFALILGFYESIFGAGNGIMFAMTTFYTRGFDFMDALGYYFSVAFPWVVFAAFLLIRKGFFDIHVAIPIVIGSLIGGYVGSKYAKYKGNKFIKMMFIIIGSILGLKLLFGL